MQYLLYCVICYKVRGTTTKVFVVDVVDAIVANHEVFTRRHTHDVEVASVQYMRANGIPSPSSMI
jgi:hypothetical protein